MEKYIDFDDCPTLGDEDLLEEDLLDEEFNDRFLQEIESLPKKALNKIMQELDKEIDKVESGDCDELIDKINL